MTSTSQTEFVVTEFERIVPLEIQRIFDRRFERTDISQQEFRAAVRQARMESLKAASGSTA